MTRKAFMNVLKKAIALGLDVHSEIKEEPGLMNRYLPSDRFQKLLKKYTIELSADAATVK